jgi:hypothetical protein
LGLWSAGANYKTLKRLIEHYEISTAHFDPRWAMRGRRTTDRKPLAEVMVQGSSYSRSHLKRRLFDEGLKRRACEACGQGEVWHGRYMALILDHINGVPNDHRLENLRILCPNCAATLETHCGRKNRTEPAPRQCLLCGAEFRPKYASHRYCSQLCGVRGGHIHGPRVASRKVERPSLQQLEEDLSHMSYLAVGRKYGVSNNAVRKWLRAYRQAAGTGTTMGQP